VRIVGFNGTSERYAAAQVTYPEQGATREVLPVGYRHVHKHDRIGTGSATFRCAVEALYSWRMHRGAGLGIASAPPVLEPGAVVVLRLGPPVVGIVVPCRVIYVVNEPDRRGFAYGTLPGHPETGEEAFIVSLDDHDEVHLTIRAFSRPTALLARAAGPLNRAVQNLVTDRYVRALRNLASPGRNGRSGPETQRLR
jgi:uncharacterized protein (UPF0548 family)